MLGVEVGRWRSKRPDGIQWAPSSEDCWKEVKRCGCDGLPLLEISLESVELYAVPHSILPNHTEGHRLNGRDALSRVKVG